MDGRGRQGSSNSGVPSAATVMPSYYGGSQPHTPSGDSASSFSPRDRFWSHGGGNGVGGPSPPDPWASGTSAGYNPQLLPPGQEGLQQQQPNFSPAPHPHSHNNSNNNSPPNNGGSGPFNIPSHSPYPPVNGNGGLNSSVNGEMGGFSGPSPPNRIQPIPLSSPYGAPPNSNSPRSRQYTPSTTPSPHVVNPTGQQHPLQSPLGLPGLNANGGINVNGINGNSSHSSNSDGSPPIPGNNGGGSNFDNYLNGGGSSGLENPTRRSPSRSNSAGNHVGQMKNGPLDSTGHPNEVPGYLPNPRQSLHNSSRYPGESKASTGEMMQQHYQHHQHHHQEQQQSEPYFHQGGYGQYQQQQNMYNYDAFQQPQPGNRRAFDPYQPYPNSNPPPGSFNDAYGSEPHYKVLRSSESLTDLTGNNNKSPGGGGNRKHGGHNQGVENGKKIDSLESLHHQQGKPGQERSSSFEEDANFEAVLHGHLNSFQNSLEDHSSPTRVNNNGDPSFNYDSIPQYETLHRTTDQNLASINNNPRSSPASAGNKSSDSDLPTPKSSSKKDKKRPRPSLSGDEDSAGKYKFNNEKSFLALGHPQSPPNVNSNSSSSQGSSDVGKTLKKSSESSQDQQQHGVNVNVPFSEGGNSTGSPNSGSNASFEPIPPTTTKPNPPRKKKPWKKAKQINSEQLLEERERNCAEYCAAENISSGGGKNRENWSKDTKVTIKEEPSPYTSSSRTQEKNITIDHQKEDQFKREQTDEKSGSRNDSNGTDEDDSCGGNGGKEKKNVPLVECGCFPIDEVHPEPGPFYTHLGSAHNLVELRETLEMRTGFRGGQVRFEKVIYTGKEGKTSQGCPLAKWIIRRGSYEEQLLFLVKHRKGHKCATAWIVVCCVIWEGVPPHFADNLYDTIVYKLNRFGIPTTRRSDTNEQRSCACQGVDPDTCGAAYSFGCAWSMFFNGCKYARSRNVRKFRLTEEHEENELEEKVQHLATHLAPLYERVAADSYKNQIEHENEGLECRLGYRPGRPFSGVTACLDYCSHAHKDAHNMVNGCTLTVAFTRNRNLGKGDDEQYHVLPLYKLDDSDEHGSKEGQKQKVKKGQLEILKKYPSKVRIRKVPLLPSRRRGKTKPPSGGGVNSSGHHSNKSGASDMYSSELTSLSMPPPSKRDKPSIFDELSGPMGGTDLFDHGSRFGHHGPGPPHFSSNLLLSKSHSHSKLGMGMSMSLEDHVQSCQISSTVLDSESAARVSSASLWTPSPYGQLQQGGHVGVGASFRSYFDPPPLPPPSHQYSAAPPPPSFGHNLDLNMNLSGTRSAGHPSGTNTNNNITNTATNSLMSPNPNNPNNNNTAVSTPNHTGSNSNAGSATTPVPGYTSMSPSSILPSFRHTFMTEAETLSLSSPQQTGGTTGSPIADSTSSPRSGKPPGQNPQLQSQHLNPPSSVAAPSAFTHQDSSGLSGLGNPSSYFNSSPVVPGYSSASANTSLYHAHSHVNPSSCLSSGGGGGGVPFNSGNPYASPASSFGPPDHHHFGMGMNINPVISPWNPPNMNMNMNPGGYSHSAYGPGSQSMNPSAPPPYHPHNQMSSLNMNMSSPAFPHMNMNMNQYNPYGSQSNFMTSPSMQHVAAAAMHPHHQWGNPLPSFMSGPHSHPPPPPASCFVAPPKPKVIPEVNETYSDNEDAFKDSHLGGVGIALNHGSVILQCAKHEMHATTSLKSPNRMYPSRICLVFYQHKSMNNRFHGWSEWEKKIEAKKLQEVKLINQGKLEASPRKMKQLIKEGYLADNP